MNMKNFPKRLDSKTSYLRITVPENLDLALEGLIRKVLKEQPKIDDIYAFAANYFETLLKIRDKAGAKFKADQLCPFHNDEDAHEMIKIAGIFSKSETEELKKKNEEFLLPQTKNVARNKDLDSKVEEKKSVRKPKSKKVSKDETTLERNKQVTSKITKKLPMAVKNQPEEEKKRTKLANGSDDINLEKNTEKKESDDEEYLASDPIKELVEKELMEIKLSSMKKQKKENTTTDVNANVKSNELITNKNSQEEQKAADSSKEQAAINDANEPFKKENIESKENKNRSEETEETKVENNEVTEQTNGESTLDIKEEKIIKFVNAEASNKPPEDMEEENKESIKGTVEIDSKSITDLKNVNKGEIKIVEETIRNAENTQDAKIITDRNDITKDGNGHLEATKSEEQTLTKEIQSEQKISKQSIVMINEATDRLSVTQNDLRGKEINKAIYSDILDKNNTTDINCNVKEQEEKNVKTSEEISPNEVRPKEKESKEPLNDQPTSPINDQIDTERVETATKDDNSESVDENKTVEISVINIKPLVTELNAEPDMGKIEMNNNQELKAQEKKMNDDEAESVIKVEATDITNSKKDEATKEVLKKTEEHNNEDNATQTEQQSKVTEQMKEIQEDEPKKAQYVLKNDEKSLETEETTKNNKDDSTARNTEENETETSEIKANETKLTSEQIINANENIKPALGSIMSQVDSKNNFLKEKFNAFSSVDEKSYQSEGNKSETSSPKLISHPANPNETIKLEKKEKLINGHRMKITEDTLFGEKTHDLEQSTGNESIRIPDEIAVIPQTQKREISESQEDKQNNQNIAESPEINKESVTQEEKNSQKLVDEASTTQDSLNANKPNEEKLNEALRFNTPDIDKIQCKDNKTESEKELRKEKSNNQAGDGRAQGREDKIEEKELNTEVDINQIPKDDETSTEKFKSKPEVKINIESEEDESRPEEELCTVIDVQQISKKDAFDGNKLEKKYKPEAENTESKQNNINAERQTIEKEREQNIIIKEADKTEENQEMSETSPKKQIKTIQSHYYNTLQVPDIVTREFRIHNVSSPPTDVPLNVVSSLQQNYERKQEEQIEETVDVNMNSTPLLEEVTNVSSSAELTNTVPPTEHLKFDNPQFVDPLKNPKTNISPPLNASDKKEVDTQKINSDDLVDPVTPISDYSLNLSELSWQTINELFLDSEKRNSSLEKEENRYYTPKSGTITVESAEIEEIIPKAVIFSSTEAVPVPPRDLETNEQTSENTEEKKEYEPKGESAESSSDSNNEQVSVNDDTPFISVEVKTVIETQILDDDDADDVDDEYDHIRNKKQNSEEKIPSDMEIRVETTIDFRNEVVVTQSDSELVENKMEMAVGTRNDLKSSLEIQDQNRQDKSKESSLTEQTTSREGSSAGSESTVSSTATEIKRADFAKRNFNSTRSLLSTQSLDLEKKNSLVKTRSLSTFRHGVTDFEVWNAIEKELEEAATKIQSKFRGYKTRKKLQRENAVQITTEESSVSVTPVEEEIKNGCQRSTGEFHDSIVLSEYPG